MTPRDKAIRELEVVLSRMHLGDEAKEALLYIAREVYDAGYAAAIERAARYLEVEHMFFDYAEDIRALKEPKP